VYPEIADDLLKGDLRGGIYRIAVSALLGLLIFRQRVKDWERDIGNVQGVTARFNV
jgi:hypothetical protein